MTQKKKPEELQTYWQHRGQLVSRNADFGFMARLRLANNCKINLKNKCLEWTGRKEKLGYGKTMVNGIFYKTHRLAAHIFFGLPLDDSHIGSLHKYDNPPSFNPKHLFVGTQVDNIADRHAKGKSRGKPQPGEKNGMAKLTDKQAAEILHIKSDYIGRGLAVKVARIYRVSRTTIQRIWRRKTFRHCIVLGIPN